MASDKKRVLVVDDSVFARKIVSDILAGSPELCVVGTAIDGIDALAKVDELRPDVITMDVEMPRLNGIETLRQLMATRPTPVVMVSSLTLAGARESMTALRLGAIDVMAKPYGTHSIGLTAQSDELVRRVVAAAGVDLTHLSVQASPAPPKKHVPVGRVGSDLPIVIIASSTGGPRALRSVIPALSASSGAAFVVIQHIPEGFSAILAQDLNEISELAIREASDGDHPEPGVLLLAKSGYHLVLGNSGAMSLSLAPPLWGVRPSADITMASAASIFGPRLIGVVLTGMGCDGAAGLQAIKQAGGATIAEHESTCVIYGMPRVAIESGAVDTVAPLDRIPEAIAKAIRATSRRRAA